MDKIFAKNLKELREERELTQKEMSSLLKMPVSTYANYEQGRRDPSIDLIREICDIFDISADLIIGTKKANY